MIDIVGHFGTLYSYASIAGRICESLRDAGMLGSVLNLDDKWHARWSSLQSQGVEMGSSHLLVIAVPHHYIDVIVAGRDRDTCAIFVSPNTDRMDEEYLSTVARFGSVIAPSKHCLDAVSSVDDIVCSVLPLGCPVKRNPARRASAAKSLRDKLKVVHFTSDQAWPGRKGTEELIQAWNLLKPDASLTIHGPESLYKNVLYMLADFDLTDSVEYVVSDRFGEEDEKLDALYDSADLIVSPSRAEGFGMMISGAIVAGTPLLTTCNTGHAEFLLEWPGRWVGIPAPLQKELAYEVGLAPSIDANVLASSLELALMDDVRASMLARAAQDAVRQGDWGTWKWAMGKWMDRLKKWSEGD